MKYLVWYQSIYIYIWRMYGLNWMVVICIVYGEIDKRVMLNYLLLVIVLIFCNSSIGGR